MDFRLTKPDLLSFKHLEYLKKALEKNPLQDDPTLWEVLSSEGEFYTWDKGVVFVEYLHGCMNVSLVGGEDIHEWKDALSKFLKDLMKEKGIKYLSILGRAAWHKIFPELKPIGTFFQYEGG